MWYLYTMEYYSAICSNMDGPRDCHTEWSKSDRERQISYDIAYMWNLKNWYKWPYLQRRNRGLSCRKQIYGYQGGKGG